MPRLTGERLRLIQEEKNGVRIPQMLNDGLPGISLKYPNMKFSNFNHKQNCSGVYFINDQRKNICIG